MVTFDNIVSQSIITTMAYTQTEVSAVADMTAVDTKTSEDEVVFTLAGIETVTGTTTNMPIFVLFDFGDGTEATQKIIGNLNISVSTR